MLPLIRTVVLTVLVHGPLGAEGCNQANNAQERRLARNCFLALSGLWVAGGSSSVWQGMAGGIFSASAAEAEVFEALAMAAVQPLIRRVLFVPGETRFSAAALNSLTGGMAINEVVSNVQSDFRFRMTDLMRLEAGLRIPASFSTRNRYRFSGTEGLLLMLYRLHFPSRVSDVAFAGGRGLSAASECFQVSPCPLSPSRPPLPPPQAIPAPHP